MDPGFVEDPGHVVVPGLDDADPRLEIAMMCSDQRSTSARSCAWVTVTPMRTVRRDFVIPTQGITGTVGS